MVHHCCDRMAGDLNRSCKVHADRSDCPDALINQVRGGYGIIVHDGGSSVVEIAFCPWCGTKLPPIGGLDLPSLPSVDE
ncbi:DUF6980 family protein [Nitrospirillum amazonense]|uniref:DUF6980 family protein n=1 Tax=Nitrospirillum amazonense TaxID=28077 RepID=UPI0011A1DA9C